MRKYFQILQALRPGSFFTHSEKAVSSRLPALAFLLFSFSFLFSCYEPKEGCLDINATNYDVEADDPCPDCCTYPSLSVSPLHQVLVKNTLDSFINLRYNVFYPAPSNEVDSFAVLRSRFFISNVHLIGAGGEAVGVTDTIGLLFQNGNRVIYEDNFAKLDRDILSTSVLGTITTEKTFDQLSFTLGLPEALLSLDTSGIPAGHPLDFRTDTLLYQDSIGYIPFFLSFTSDTSASAPPTEVRLFQPLEISLPLVPPVHIKRGHNVKIRLRINYMAWFEGVDFTNDSDDTKRQKIAANLPNAFTVTEIILD